MVLTLSTLGQPPSCSSPSRRNNNHDKIGDIPLKKRQHLRTEEDFSSNNNNDIELRKKKKVEENKTDTQEEISCFLAIVKASNLHKDAMDLPKDFTSSNGFKRDFREIVITNDGKRSWALDLRFKELSKTFYMKKGWRKFCEENGQKAGDFFIFDLVKNKGKLSLSFCPKKSKKAGAQGDKDNNIEKWRNTTSSSKNRFVTLTVTSDSLKHSRLVSSEEETPMFNFFSNSSNDRRQQGESCFKAREKESVPTEPSSGNKTKKATKDIEKSPSQELEGNMCLPNGEHSSSLIQDRLVKLTLESEDVKAGKMHLPREFMKANGINKLGKIEILGKNKMQWFGYMISNDGTVALGAGWEGFCEAHGVKKGDSFILKFLCEKEGTPVVKFCPSIEGCIGCGIFMDLVEFLI